MNTNKIGNKPYFSIAGLKNKFKSNTEPVNFSYNRKEIKMFEKKQPSFTTPDLTKLQEVIIDVKTRIYIAVGADPKEARSRYLARIGAKKL